MNNLICFLILAASAGLVFSDEKSVDTLIREAEKGDAEAQFQLGEIYDFGLGVANDNSEAVKWYGKAARQGHAKAQFNLGMMYHNGEGVARDYIQAYVWFNINAAASKSGERDRALTMSKYTENKMKKAQIAKAQYNLGTMYQQGQSVRQDLTEAARWFRQAGERGFRDAQYNLGKMYSEGLGVPSDYAEAAKWFRKAAEQNHDMSQDALGTAYYYARGVKQDNISAYMWFVIAASNGCEMSLKNLDLVAKKMNPGEIEDAKRRAQICMQSDYRECD